jgi:G3E family GTPase
VFNICSFAETPRVYYFRSLFPLTHFLLFSTTQLQTSALKHLLENTEGVKIGVIVNDVASVNIDAKLISGQSSDGGMVELQNGCACCSLADELLTSVDTMLSARSKADQFDAIVVELSGVADPVAIKSNWQMAKLNKHPATFKTDISRVVTLVDACTFGSDWMTYDMAANRNGWTEDGDDCAGQRKVTELLAEQVECADLILVNKVDMATADEIKVASSVARGLNSKADLQNVEFGKISPSLVLGDMIGDKAPIEAEHDHGHAAAEDCAEPGCTDSSHAHSHDHTAAAADCAEPACTDTSHSHAHSSHDDACSDADCTDESHSHSHAHAEGDDCADPECADTSHSHSHSSHGTELDQLGITNFVYKREIPFHAKRLLELLNQWPVPIKENLDLTLMQEAQKEGYSISGVTEAGSPFVGVLRSKGFVWLAPNKWMGANDDAYRHDTAMYWSHAGKHFGISSAGKWWGTIPREQIKDYFPTDEKEYSRIMTEDFVSDEWGDRRQGEFQSLRRICSLLFIVVVVPSCAVLPSFAFFETKQQSCNIDDSFLH